MREIEALLLQLAGELRDVESGRRATLTNAGLLSVAIMLRMRRGRRLRGQALSSVALDSVEQEWCLLAERLDALNGELR